MTSPHEKRFLVSERAAKWFRDSFRYRGVLRTMSMFLVRLFEFGRDLTPSRRRLRFGDLQFDFDHNVDTTWSNVGLSTRIRELFSGEAYQPIEADLFHNIVGSLNLDYSRFTFIDLGSGKGRALLLASEYPFREIIGVEILPELHATAERNLNRYTGAQRCARISPRCGDARDFVFPAGPTVLYLFNPFFEPVLQAVMRNLKRSLVEHPREMILIYANPLSEEIVNGSGFLTKLGGTHQYSIYSASGRL